MLQKIIGDVGIDKRSFSVVSLLLVNAFSWLFFIIGFIEEVIKRTPDINEAAIWSAFYLSIIVFSLIGAVLSKRVRGLKFHYFWIVLGVIASLLSGLVIDFDGIQFVGICALLGASFGLGIPSCLAFFTEVTKVENRGRVGGIILLITNLVALLVISPFEDLSLIAIPMICAIWRGTALTVHFLKQKNHNPPEIAETSFVSILRSRPFLLYFVSWLMFSLVDIMETPIVKGAISNELFKAMEIIEPVIAAFCILIGAFMCDWVGRKKIVLSGFVSLGAAYAIIGFLVPPPDGIVWYLYFVVDGAAWGIFYLTFILILWGDLSQSSSREKYYALGSIPFFISYIIPHFVELPSDELVAAFSVAAFFLFLAVLSLIYAPETLPEKKMEIRRLRSFAEEAQKAKEKYERKSGN